MAWVTPQPGTAGQVYTAAAHNVIVDDLTELAPFFADWTAYDPPLTNMAIGTGGNAGKESWYLKIGRLVHWRGYARLGTSGASVTGDVTVTLPFTARTQAVGANPSITLGSARFGDVGVRGYIGICYLSTTTALSFNEPGNAAGGALSSAAPFTWGAGDWLTWTIAYEAAS